MMDQACVFVQEQEITSPKAVPVATCIPEGSENPEGITLAPTNKKFGDFSDFLFRGNDATPSRWFSSVEYEQLNSFC